MLVKGQMMPEKRRFPVVHTHAPASGIVPRRLTPLECERLQGFPDNWTEFYADGSRVADGPRYRMMGNAVTVNVAEWIGQRIRSANEYS